MVQQNKKKTHILKNLTRGSENDMKKSVSKVYRKLISSDNPYRSFRMIEDMEPEKAKEVLQMVVMKQLSDKQTHREVNHS